MKTRKIDIEEWNSYLDSINVELRKKQVFLEIASLAFGDQIASDWTKLHEITYDPKFDLCDIAVPGIKHRICKPQEIHVAYSNAGIEAIEIKDADGIKHVMRLREPLALPALDIVES